MTSPALRSLLHSVPRPVLASAGLLVAQAVGFTAFGIYEFTQVQAGRVGTGLTSALLIMVWGLGLGACGWALLNARRWARGAVVAAQIIHLPTAWSFRGGETTWVALGLGLTSAAILALVLLPASTRHLVGSGEDR